MTDHYELAPFTPELGQLAYSNGGWYQVPADELETGLRIIGDAVQELTGSDPCGNIGAEYVCPEFTLRSYCWCDGAQHPNGCPPNFDHRASGLQVSWYKRVGRSMSANRLPTRWEWLLITTQCVRHVIDLAEETAR